MPRPLRVDAARERGRWGHSGTPVKLEPSHQRAEGGVLDEGRPRVGIVARVSEEVGEHALGAAVDRPCRPCPVRQLPGAQSIFGLPPRAQAQHEQLNL